MAAAIIAAATAPGGAAMAQQSDSTVESTNRQVVQQHFDAWSQGHGTPFDLLAEHVTWTIPGNSAIAGTYRGRAAFMRDVIGPFNARLSRPLRPTVRDIYATSNTVIIVFDGEAMADDAIPYRNTYAWFFVLRDGVVVEATAFFDSIAFDEMWRRVSPE
ncbi:MAG: nuclear transport factor 2 family protein [Longimicrobiales bacterium]